MADILLQSVDKIYDGGIHAVRNLDLVIEDGELMVLLGPSGCGKSTVLRLVAGLEGLTSGEIRVGGRRVDHEPPDRRDVAMVFQSYALYGHMTVAENIEFPLRMRGVPRSERRARARETAELLELTPLLASKPGALSGGQQQRVAMGRALVRRPAAFLLDEPLSNLDARLRVHVREEIRRVQRRLGVTTVHVTHDQVEALSLGDRVAVLKDGEVQQHGPGQELYDRPGNTFVATFLGQPGMNLVHGRFRGSATHAHRADGLGAEAPHDGWAVELAGTARTVAASRPPERDPPVRDGDPVQIGIRPEAVELVDEDPSALTGIVRTVEELGSERVVHLDLAGAPEGAAPFAIRVGRGGASPRPGDRLHLAPRAERIRVFDVRGDAIELA